MLASVVLAHGIFLNATENVRICLGLFLKYQHEATIWVFNKPPHSGARQHLG